MKNNFKIIGALLIVISTFFVKNYSLAQKTSSDKINPVIWKTAYNEFSSSNFYIQIGDKKFYGNDQVKINSDPGLDKTTLELTWPENGVSMRFYLYFQKIKNGLWELYDLRTYNSTGSDWIYYPVKDDNGTPVTADIGQRDFNENRIFTSKDGQAKIYCQDCSFTAFIKSNNPTSAYGYAINFMIGLPENETITLNTDPVFGYGVNAVLVDKKGNVVKNQSGFTYSWKVENKNLLSFNTKSVPDSNTTCAYGIKTPCPKISIDMSGTSPGITRIILDVIRKSDKAVIATNSFNVKVIDKNSTSSTAQNNGSQVENSTDEAGTNIANQQQKNIGLIQKILKSIQEFFKNFFRKLN